MFAILSFIIHKKRILTTIIYINGMVAVQQCEQIVFAIDAHVFGRQAEGYYFKIAELRDHTRSRPIAELIHEFS